MALAAQPARAEPEPESLSLDLELDGELARLAGRPSLGRQLKTKLTLWGNELGSHLNLLTMDLLDLELDVHLRHANLRLGTVTPRLGFRLAGDIQMRGDVARVKTRLTLGLRQRTLELDLPTFEIASQSVEGERSVELRLPILEGSF